MKDIEDSVLMITNEQDASVKLDTKLSFGVTCSANPYRSLQIEWLIRIPFMRNHYKWLIYAC